MQDQPENSSHEKALRLADQALTRRERDYYLAVADCVVNSYGHGANIAKAQISQEHFKGCKSHGRSPNPPTTTLLSRRQTVVTAIVSSS